MKLEAKDDLSQFVTTVNSIVHECCSRFVKLDPSTVNWINGDVDGSIGLGIVFVNLLFTFKYKRHSVARVVFSWLVVSMHVERSGVHA